MLKIILAIIFTCLVPSTVMAEELSNGWYTIQTKSPLYRVDSTDGGLKVSKAEKISGQKFLLTKLSDGKYKIGTGQSAGTKVLGTDKIVAYSGKEKWEIKESKDGSYTLMDVNTKKYLTYNKDNKISEQKSNNSEYQKFYFTNYTENFTVTFKDGFGEILSRQSVKEGEGAIAPKNPTKKGYTFAGWDKKFDKITENITVTAKWTTDSYTVTFTDGQGNKLKTQTVKKGANATAPANPTRTGYVFNGWDKSYSNIKANTTINAKWTAKTVKVVFHNDTKTYTETYTYGAPTQTFGMKLGNKSGDFGTWKKEGYTLLGWSFDKNATNRTYTVYSNVNNGWIDKYSGTVDLYPVWQEKNANVTDGWYVIKPTLDTSYAVDVYGNKSDNKTNISLYKVNGTDAQKFFIHKIDNETYSICTGTPGYKGALDVTSGAKNGNIQQYEYTGVNAQRWKIVKSGNGGYVFYNKATGNVLDIEGDDTLKDGKNLCDYQYLNGADKGQTFTLTPTSEPSSVAGKKKIVFKGTNQVVNVSKASVLDKAIVISYVNEDYNNAKWAFEKVADGTYHIRSLVSDKYLLDKGGKIVQSRGSSDNFKWKTVWNGDGSVSFKNAGTGKYLYTSNTANGVQLTTSANKSSFNLPSTDYTQVVSNGTYLIKNQAGMYLTTEYNNWNNQTKIAGANNVVDTKKGMRLFRITYLGDGFYRFETGSSIYKSSIDMPSNVDAVGTQPQQYRNNDVAAQKFRILGSGNYRIVHGLNAIQTTTNTNPCTMQALADNNAQKFTFIRDSGYLIQDTYKYYFREDGTTPKLAIDVSKWQGNINWQTIKDAGRVDFVIIRMLDHSSTTTTGVDEYALKNIEACERLGIPYGVYWYSMATTTSELKSELSRLWSALGSHKPTKGIWFDMEAVGVYKSAWGDNWQSNGTGKTKLTEFINYAKSDISSHGFEPGLYLNPAQISCIKGNSFGIKWWVPRYFTRTVEDTNLLDLNEYKGAYMWQWSDVYTMAGINGSRVDVDCVLYDDKYTWNGSTYVNNVNNSYTIAKSSTPTTGKTGWYSENGATYYYKDGVKYTGWHKMTAAEGETTEHYSYFGNDGKLVKGWFTADSGYEKLRYADDKGWVYGPCGFKTNVATSPNYGVKKFNDGTAGELKGSYYFNDKGELTQVIYNNFTHLNQRSYFVTSSVNYGNGCGPVSGLMAANMMGKLTKYIGASYKTSSDRYSASASFREYMKTWQNSTNNTYVGRTGGNNGVWNYQIKNNLKGYHGVDAEYMEDNTMYSTGRMQGLLTWGRVSIPFCNVKLDGSYTKHFMVVNGWRLNNGAVQYHVVDPYGTTKLDPNCAGQNDGWYSVDGMNSITYKGSAKANGNESSKAVRNFTTVGTRMKFGY